MAEVEEVVQYETWDGGLRTGDFLALTYDQLRLHNLETQDWNRAQERAAALAADAGLTYLLRVQGRWENVSQRVADTRLTGWRLAVWRFLRRFES